MGSGIGLGLGLGPAAAPIYGDAGEVEGLLAAVAERHFRAEEVRETETLALFLCAVKMRSVVPGGL